MQRIATRPVFTVGTRTYLWPDVVVAAHLWGDYAALERQTRDGLAWVMHLAKKGQGVSESDADELGDAWRYDRDLLAADDLQQWLDEHLLGMDEWLAFIERAVLRSRGAAPRIKVPAADVEAAIYAEAVCSGTLQGVAARLAGLAAAYDRVDAEGKGAHCPKTAVRNALKPLPAAVRRDGVLDLGPRQTLARAEHVACLQIVCQRFLDAAVAPAALEREIETHRLDWTRLVCETAPFASEEAAREAALLVREDSFPLADAAAMGKTTVTRTRFVLDDIEPPLRDRLVGARPGDLIAPVASNGNYLVVSVVERVEPTAKDRDVRTRAADRIAARTIQREVENRVRWHDRF